MENYQYYFIHIYYNRHEFYKFYFGQFGTGIENILSELEEYGIIDYLLTPGLKNGDHIKLFLRFDGNINKGDFVEKVKEKLNEFLKQYPSAPVNSNYEQTQNYFMDYQNNSIVELVPLSFFSASKIIEDGCLDVLFKYTKHLIPLAKHDLDGIITSSMVVSHTLISAFTEDDKEQTDFMNWLHNEVFPKASWYSRKDKELKKQKMKELKEFSDSLRRDYHEQKESIKNLINHYSTSPPEDIDIVWLDDLKKDMLFLKDIINKEKHTLNEDFKYQTNGRTELKRQEKWPVLKKFLYYVFDIVSRYPELEFVVIFSLKEHYANEEKLLNIEK